jgi:hypothetical protein
MEYQGPSTELKHVWNVEAKNKFYYKILHALYMFRQGYIIIADVLSRKWSLLKELQCGNYRIDMFICVLKF